MTASQPLKVLFVIDSLGRGGAERALLNLIPALRAIDIEPTVVALTRVDDLKNEFRQTGAEIVTLDFGYKWRLIKNTRILAKYLATAKPDIVHAHLFFSGIYVGLGKYLYRSIPRIISFHNLAYAPGCNPRNISYFLRKALNRFVVKHCMDRRIAVSSAVAEHYSKNTGMALELFCVIPNGLPVHLWHHKEPGQSSTTKKTIVALGRLVPEKGYKYLLNAYREVRQRYAGESELRIIGGGPLGQELKDLAVKLDLGDRVTFLGGLEHSDAMEELQDADVFVTASIFEGFGLSVAEAMLADLPVVATSVGGLGDVVQPEFAEIVEPANASQLAQAMIRSLTLADDDRIGRTRMAKDFVVAKFSVDSVAGNLKGLYLEALDPHG